MSKKGALVAAAVAGMFASAIPLVASAKDEGKVMCKGGNDCSGKGGCKSADNACKGKNSCKGHVFMTADAKACAKAGGSKMDAPAK